MVRMNRDIVTFLHISSLLLRKNAIDLKSSFLGKVFLQKLLKSLFCIITWAGVMKIVLKFDSNRKGLYGWNFWIFYIKNLIDSKDISINM